MSFLRAPSALLSIGTANPPYHFEQAQAATFVADSLDASPALRRWLRQLYKLSAIETRYSCLPDAGALSPDTPFAPGRSLERAPGTAERMAIYEQASVDVAADAARQALGDRAADVTHLIVVSCTGFFAPGPDLALARRLGLPADVQRSVIGFMGCAAAFNALRLADQIVAGRPDALVLIVCVELCTLHIQPGADREDLTAASLFADGAGACLVGAPQPGQEMLLIDNFFTGVTPDTESDMAWRIGNHGFKMRLSPEVPRQVARVVRPALHELLPDGPAPEFWAIHPGGPAIVDRVAETCDLSDNDVQASRDVLRNYGNMSSPTILFVLDAIRRQLRSAARPATGVAMAFGPGLVAEMAALRYVPAGEQLDQQQLLPADVYAA
jgi:predicted naringenin-chalcone synthase